MEVSEDTIMQLLGQLTNPGGFQNKPWMTYGGIQQGPVTLVQQARAQIEKASQALLGPLFGGIIGPHAADFLVGKDFTRTGMLQNRLSGILAPEAGSFSSAYQRLRNQQVMATLTQSRQQQDRELKRSFYTNYYNITNPGQDNTEAIDAALRNPVSLPGILGAVFDPAKNKQIMQGIKNTQAGFLNWHQRMSGNLDIFEQRDAAKLIGQSVGKLSMNANLYQLGMQDQITDQRYKGKSYGGFSGASIAQLSSIIANTSDVFDPKDLQNSIQKFEKKVQDTAKALSPLKDIFGNDMKAMTDMLQSVTGQNINQLSPTMISSIAKSTVDMSRYSGATVAQIAQAGQKLFVQTAATGQNSFARLGGGLMGAYYSGLMAQGNSPAGVHAAQYAATTQRALASAQTSAGADFAAMAYGIWSDMQGNKGKSIDDFMNEVNSRAGNSGNIMKAIMDTARVTKQQDLLKGLSSTGYRVALQSGRMAELGIKGQYREQLSDAIGYMKAANTDKDISIADWDKLEKVLKDNQNASAIKTLITHANDPQAVIDFARKFGLNQKAINKYINTADMQQYTARWASGIQMDAYRQGQQKIRKEFKVLDQQGANGFNAFWQAASQGEFENGRLRIKGKVTELSKKQAEVQGRMLFGDKVLKAQGKNLDTFAQIQEAVHKLQDTGAFGKQASQVLALASTQFSNDQTYLQSLRTMVTADKNSKEWKQAKGYIQARRLGYIGKQTGKDFKNTEAKTIYDDAMRAYQKQTADLDIHATDDVTRGKIKSANETLDRELGKARRLQNISRMSASQLGLSGAFDTKKKALSAYIKGGSKDADALLQMSQDKFKEAAGKYGLKGFTKAQFQTAYKASSANYGNAVDMQRMIYTVLDQLLSWLRKQGGNK